MIYQGASMMRKLLIALSFVAAAASVAPLAAAEREVAFSRIGVSVNMEKTPYVEYKGTKIDSYKTHSKNTHWAVIVVDYYPGMVRAGKADSKIAKSVRGGWIDDVTCEVSVEMPMDGSDKKSTGLLTGKCTLWSVALDGKIHTLLMLIPPQILDRYMPLRGASEFVAKASDFRVQVVFRDSNGSVLGEGYCNLNVKDDQGAAYFDKLRNGVVIKDAVLPRNKTPWAFHCFDRYDLLKSE